MSCEQYFLFMALTAGVVTIALRAFPFILFSGNRPVPPLVRYLGKVLSPAAIAMLVIYCYCSSYRSVTFADGGFGIPEFTASLVVVALQLWKRNPLISIIAGTTVYMLIKHYLF